MSDDGSRECCSRWSTWSQLSSPTAVSTVGRLPPHVSVLVEAAAVFINVCDDSGLAVTTCVDAGRGGGGVGRRQCRQWVACVAACVDDVRRRQCRQWVGCHLVCRCWWRCCWWQSPAVSTKLQSAEHLETAVLGAGSVDDGSAVASCVGVCGGGRAARRPQSRVPQPSEQLETAVLTDGSVESKSAVASCVGVGGGGLVQDDRSRECSSRQRQCRYWIGCRLVCRCRWRRR